MLDMEAFGANVDALHPAVGAYRQARASARYDVSGALARVQDATRSIAARAAA